MKAKLPVFMCWDAPDPKNNKWSFGHWTGPDDDLICIKPHINKLFQSEILLSPVCRSRTTAVFAFFIKNILFSIDENMIWTYNK